MRSPSRWCSRSVASPSGCVRTRVRSITRRWRTRATTSITVSADAVEALRAALRGQELLGPGTGRRRTGRPRRAGDRPAGPRVAGERAATRTGARSPVPSRAVTPPPSPGIWTPLPRSIPNWPRRTGRIHCAPRSGRTPPRGVRACWSHECPKAAEIRARRTERLSHAARTSRTSRVHCGPPVVA